MAKETYLIGGMDCAHCAHEVETGVRRLEGVQSVQVDFATGKMVLEGAVPFDTLQARVEALGKTLIRPEDADEARTMRGGVLGFWDYLTARRETQLALIGGALVLMVFLLSLVVALPEAVRNGLYTAGLLITLYPIARSGLNGLRINRQFNINLLMTIAAFGAIAIGEFLEGATVIFLFAVGEALEGYTTDRARSSIRSLMALRPAQATRLHAGREESIPVEQLRVGDLILVKPGEGIPMDGRVQTGMSSVNQAPITGESIPVMKAASDDVYAGTINGEGALTVEVTRLAQDNTLSRIIQMVEEAQGVRAPSQRMIDRFAQVYTPAVVVMAATVAFMPPLLFNAPFWDTATGHGWLYRALVMLVIACPCALVISTPVTVISAITAAARRGVLIKGGAHLEALGTMTVFAFDKTGTLTAGRPTVTRYRAADCATGDPCALCDDVLALASAVERRASHPLALAVQRAAETAHLESMYAPAETVETLAGRGVRGSVNGHLVTVGSHSLFDTEFPHTEALCAEVQAAEAQGQTTMLLAQDAQVRGYITLLDEPRPTSRDAVQALNAMGMTTVMLTGDHARVAGRIGEAVGVTDVRAGLLPQDKVAAVEALRAAGGMAMVGDGINDTPALAAATVGIAMGGAGSPQALETADVALMADDLTQLPFVVQLSRFARALIRQNIALSMGVKLLFLTLAVGGLSSLWLAIAADVGMLLLVTLNGMRPLRFER
ncbi:MAG: heavy metal translocating P-type ATPase [Anaerolineae bacterium]